MCQRRLILSFGAMQRDFTKNKRLIIVQSLIFARLFDDLRFGFWFRRNEIFDLGGIFLNPGRRFLDFKGFSDRQFIVNKNIYAVSSGSPNAVGFARKTDAVLFAVGFIIDADHFALSFDALHADRDEIHFDGRRFR